MAGEERVPGGDARSPEDPATPDTERRDDVLDELPTPAWLAYGGEETDGSAGGNAHEDTHGNTSADTVGEAAVPPRPEASAPGIPLDVPEPQLLRDTSAQERARDIPAPEPPRGPAVPEPPGRPDAPEAPEALRHGPWAVGPARPANTGAPDGEPPTTRLPSSEPPPAGEPWSQFAPPPGQTSAAQAQLPPPPPAARPMQLPPPNAQRTAAPGPANRGLDLEPDPFPAAAYTEPSVPERRAHWPLDDPPGGQAPPPADRFAPGADPDTLIHYRGDADWNDEPLRRPPLFRRLVIATVAFAVLVAAFLVLAFVNQGDKDDNGKASTAPPPAGPGPGTPGTPSAGPSVLPGAAPPGWTRDAAWTVRVAAPSARVAPIAASTRAVAVLTPDNKVAVLDPVDGRVRRTFDLPPGDHRGVKLAVVDSTLSVLVHAGTKLAYAPADGSAAPTVLDVPDSAAITYAGDAPLIVAATGVFVIQDGRLAEVRVPPGATAMAADGARVVAAASEGPWWLATPGRDPVAVNPAPPRPGAVIHRIAAAGHNRVVVMWRGADAATISVVLYDATTGQPQMNVDVPSDETRRIAWVWGADDQTAALGAVVFDLKAGKAHLRSGFAPVIGWGNLLYGQTAADPQTPVVLDATDPNRAPAPLGPGVPLPWGGPTGKLILILDTARSTAPTLYALRPDPTATGGNTALS